MVRVEEEAREKSEISMENLRKFVGFEAQTSRWNERAQEPGMRSFSLSKLTGLKKNSEILMKESNKFLGANLLFVSGMGNPGIFLVCGWHPKLFFTSWLPR